jgi:hypothetical protein
MLDEIFKLVGVLAEKCADLLKEAKELQAKVEAEIKAHGGFDGSAGDLEYQTAQDELEANK